jgi:hypothetical protein
LQEKYDFSDQQITKKIVPEAHVYQKKKKELLPGMAELVGDREEVWRNSWEAGAVVE